MARGGEEGARPGYVCKCVFLLALGHVARVAEGPAKRVKAATINGPKNWRAAAIAASGKIVSPRRRPAGTDSSQAGKTGTEACAANQVLWQSCSDGRGLRRRKS